MVVAAESACLAVLCLGEELQERVGPLSGQPASVARCLRIALAQFQDVSILFAAA